MKKTQFVTALVMSGVLAAGCTAAAMAASTTAETTADTAAETAADTSAETTADTADASAEAVSESTETETLSDDIFSFQLSYDGDIYQFPMTYADFTAAGWTYEDDDTEQLEANSLYSTLVFNNGDNSVYASMVNFDVSALPLSSCYVVGVDFDSFNIKDTSKEILIPGGFKYGEALKDDVIAAYGPADDEYTGSTYTSETYDRDYYQDVELEFDASRNVLIGVRIENVQEPENMTYSEASSEVPELNTMYTAPTEMSDEPTDYTITLADKIYKLPAPVSVFTENGWTIDTEDSETQAAGGGSAWVTFTQGSMNFRTLTHNYQSNAVTIENCFVDQIDIDNMTENIPLTIFKGITFEMTQEDVEAALTGIDYQKNDQGDLVYYTIGEYPDMYDICVSKEDNSVISIGIQHEPDLETLESEYSAQ